MFHHQRLWCFEMTLETARRVPDLVGKWPRGYGDLADQLKRAISSIALNTAEGNERKSPKDRARFFDIARGSAAEAAAAIEVSRAFQITTAEDAAFFLDKLIQIVRMLAKLT